MQQGAGSQWIIDYSDEEACTRGAGKALRLDQNKLRSNQNK